MKKAITLLAVISFILQAHTQGLWQQRATCPGAHEGSVSFSINSAGYVYTGQAANNFYLYDPSTDTWTAKADFPGGLRYGAAGFATDSFGYVGTGKNSGNTPFNDFYKYDPANNTWVAKANYPDSIQGAFSFSVSNTGYFAGGMDITTTTVKKCYAYDETNNQWLPKDSLPYAIAYGFSNVVNGKAYGGLGITNLGGAHTDSVYEYNPVANTWQSKAGHHLTSSNLYQNVHSFVVGNKIYASDPRALTGTHGAMGVYDPAGNSWSVINTAPYPTGSGCDPALSLIGLTVGTRGYYGTASCNGITYWEFNPNESFAISSFTPDTVCEGDLVQVSFTSSLAFSAGNHFKLKFNGTSYGPNHATSDSVAGTTAGTYTFQVPNVITSGNTTLAELAVYSTNPANQTAYYAPKIFIKRGPQERYFQPSYTRCDGSAILLYRTINAPGESHYWSSNPAGITDTANFISLTPTQNTVIYVTDIYNATGCTANDSTLIYFHTLPSLQITDSLFSICAGGSATLGGTAVNNGAYTWTGSGLNSALVNPVVSPVANSTYHLILTDTLTTCRAEGNSQVVLAQPPAQTICFVTVDSASTHNVIVWEKLDVSATDSFFIYREISTNNYQRIGAVHGDSLSEFHDYTANPNVTAYRYKIANTDTCINSSALSPYHNTIHLQYLGSGNLIWNVYQIENAITPVNSFDVYRDSLGNGNWQVMVNVPGNQYTATDINFNQHPNALYRIVANWAYSCTASRSGSSQVLSNIISITGTGISGLNESNYIQLYPNPAQNELFISSSKSKIEQLRVFTIDGNMLMTAQPVQNRMDISPIPAGIYIAEIKTKEGTVVKRWVKM